MEMVDRLQQKIIFSIFANKTPVKVRDWNPENAGNKTYSNNLYYNITNLPNDAAAVKVDANTNTKVLVNPGSGPSAVAEDNSARRHEDPPLQQYLMDTNLQKTLLQSMPVKS